MPRPITNTETIINYANKKNMRELSKEDISDYVGVHVIAPTIVMSSYCTSGKSFGSVIFITYLLLNNYTQH